jgi:hypothetical protein
MHPDHAMCLESSFKTLAAEFEKSSESFSLLHSLKIGRPSLMVAF